MRYRSIVNRAAGAGDQEILREHALAPNALPMVRLRAPITDLTMTETRQQHISA
jgi:hypothetical protein